jgi:hypothetical protein
METLLEDSEIKKLRATGVISNEETALRVGDLLVAENVCTRARRVIDAKNVLAESGRRVLKG